jgi:hypothetical protein
VGHVDADEDRFYALVDFKDDHAPACYVVPSGTVREAAESHHGLWLQSRGSSPSRILKVQDPFGREVAGYPPGWLSRFADRWDFIPRR